MQRQQDQPFAHRSTQGGVPMAALPPGDTATILLVEDDPFLASARKSVLEKRLGRVHRTADPAEALRLVGEPDSEHKLRLAIVSGRHLLGMSRPDFVAELIARHPCLPILVLAADDLDQPHTYVQLSRSVHFLSRPLSADRLLAAARDLLSCEMRRTA